MKQYLITEQIKNDILNCIANATHHNVSYLQVNKFIELLQQLKEYKNDNTADKEKVGQEF